MGEQQPDRLKDEIEEILNKIEHFPKPESARARARRRALRRSADAIASAQRAAARQLARISVSQLMLLSFVVIIGSLFFRRLHPLAMQWLLYAGIVLFVSSFAMLVFMRSPGARQQQRWRGRRIEYRAPSLWERLRSRYRDRGGRRRR